MSETEKKRYMVTFCPDREDVLPLYSPMESDKKNRETLKEFCEKRGVKKEEVKQRPVFCNVETCNERAELILEYSIPGIEPDYYNKNSIIVDGRYVTCLCQKHNDRLSMTLIDRIFILEERVDELEKLQERNHEIFEYSKDND